MKAKNTLRIKIVTGLIIAFALLLIGRLYNVQIIHGSSYSDRADRQYVKTNSNFFDRGNIFLKDSVVSGAGLKTGFTVAINPSILKDPEDTYEKLSTIIPLDKEAFLLRTRDKTDPYEEIAHRVDTKLGEEISKLNISGVDIYQDRWRFYPGGSLAAQTIGFVASDGDGLSGMYGLERYYNDILSRKDDEVDVNFFAEIFANLNKTIFNQSSGRAGDIVTSIDPSVQIFLERKLATVQEKWDSKLTAGIIMNPQNGEIYALAVNPTFDLNNFGSQESVSIFGNPLIENIYEMGSIMKPLTMVAGLDTGIITPETTYNDRGYLKLNGSTISNFDGKGRGIVSMQEVLSQSLNTGVSFIVSEIGNDVFADYMRSLVLERKQVLIYQMKVLVLLQT